MSERREWVVQELRRLGKVAAGIQARWQAYFGLHNAACMNDDPVEMQERREQLHDTLDMLLDNGEAIQKLTNEADTFT